MRPVPSAATLLSGKAEMQRYLPQLDGLRAVAVLLVIGTHTGYIRGGYVGVDIFFALSGYLITAILLRDRAEGRWSLKRFYVRRARRLYPALVLMLIVMLPIGGMLVPGHYPAAAVAAAAYLSDFIKAVNVNWLDGLSHTWSLAVEEQFYLTWPAFLAFSLRRVSPGILLVTTVGLAALMLGMLGRGSALASTMFLPTSRGGGLLLGCALALALDIRGLCPRPSLVATGSAAGVVVAVVLGGHLADGGLAAGLAALAAVGVIAGVLDGGWVAGALSRRPLVWLGQRSYGVYLWHVPIVYILARGELLPSRGSLLVLLPTLAGSVGLAALSYRLVESRFRPDKATQEIAPPGSLLPSMAVPEK